MASKTFTMFPSWQPSLCYVPGQDILLHYSLQKAKEEQTRMYKYFIRGDLNTL